MCAIFLTQDDGSIVAMTEAPYEAEDVLQRLLAGCPALLAGDDGADDGGPRWLLIQREIGVADDHGAGDRWSLDHLFVDRDGIPTLVEVKRSTNTQIRREVVGQILDYAANASAHWPDERIRSAFEARPRQGVTAEEELAEFLGDDDPDEFWERVATNLAAAKLRLVIVADVIPSELRRIIEFLNEQMSRTEVLGLEVRQYREVDGTRTTLVPRLIGNTQAAIDRKPQRSRGPKLTEADIRERFVKTHPEAVARHALDLLTRLREHAVRVRTSRASIIVRVATRRGPVDVGFWKHGGISVNLRHFSSDWQPADLKAFVDELGAVPALAASVDESRARDHRAFLDIPVAQALASDHDVDVLYRTLVGTQDPEPTP